MNGFKGTPGPWFGMVDGSFKPTAWNAENYNAQVSTVAPITDKNGKTVALVVSEEWSDEGLDANAALIASAPAMATLLNEINNWLVCACIATPEDMAQSFEEFQKQIDEVLTAGGLQ